MKSPNKFIPIAQPDLNGNELKYLTDCVSSNWISSKGRYIEKFEEVFADFIGCKYAVSASNGTAALHLAMTALGIGYGDEVIVPDLTFVASANAVVYTGAKPVLVDVDRKTWNIDTLKVGKKITKRTKAIMVVHLYGSPADMETILSLARKYKLLVIEDAAEAHGAEIKISNIKYQKSKIRNKSLDLVTGDSSGGERGSLPAQAGTRKLKSEQWKRVGSIGEVGCFSFYGNKIITTGEGGMVTTSDKKLYEKMKILRDHGQKPNHRYYHEIIGFNYRMTNLQAAIGVAQMERIRKFIRIKRNIAKMYDRQLRNILGIALPVEKAGYRNVYWMYSIVVDKPYPQTRDQLMKHLIKNGIETRPFFYPIHRLPPYRIDGDFLDAAYLSNHGINLPSSICLIDEDIKRISDVIRQNIS